MTSTEEKYIKDLKSVQRHHRYLRWIIPLFFFGLATFCFYVSRDLSKNNAIGPFSDLTKGKQYSVAFIWARELAYMGMLYFAFGIIFAYLLFSQYKSRDILFSIIDKQGKT